MKHKIEQYQEIDLGNNNKLIFFQNWDFWDKILPSSVLESERIDIVTYNFNFKHQQEKSVYNKLLSLAEKGVYVRLFYSPEAIQKGLIDDIFGNEILCVELPNNHCKIFVSDNKAYIGSANFSLGSNNNYECGFFTENKEVIDKIRTTMNNFIWKNGGAQIITIPDIGDPLFEIYDIIKDAKRCLNQIEDPTLIGKPLWFNYDSLYCLGENISRTCLPCSIEELLRFHSIFEDIINNSTQDTIDLLQIKKHFVELIEYLDEFKKELIPYYEKYGKYEINS